MPHSVRGGFLECAHPPRSCLGLAWIREPSSSCLVDEERPASRFDPSYDYVVGAREWIHDRSHERLEHLAEERRQRKDSELIALEWRVALVLQEEFGLDAPYGEVVKSESAVEIEGISDFRTALRVRNLLYRQFPEAHVGMSAAKPYTVTLE